MKQHLCLIAALGVCFFALTAAVYAQHIRSDTGGIAIGGSVTSSTIIIGIPKELVDELVREAKKSLEELTAQQRDNIALLKEKLDLNIRQVRAALDILGENDIPPERLAAKLVEIAKNFKALQATALPHPGDDPKIAALKTDAQKAVDGGELGKADALLADVEWEMRHVHDRLAVNAAETSAGRGEIALTRLRYGEAAKHFASAAAVLSPKRAYEGKQINYLQKEASALFQQGNEFDDKKALLLAIERRKRLVKLIRRERVPLDWAATQNDLGIALFAFGDRENEITKLKDATIAYRKALKERTRERVPLDWAVTQNNLGNALLVLGRSKSGTAKLKDASIAYREALKERTRERVPLDWAVTQNNLGNALLVLGSSESGTAKLEEAVAAYREAQTELTRERAPLQWASSFGNQGVALMLLAERRRDLGMARTAESQIEAASRTMRNSGNLPGAAYYEEQLPRALAIARQLLPASRPTIAVPERTRRPTLAPTLVLPVPEKRPTPRPPNQLVGPPAVAITKPLIPRPAPRSSSDHIAKPKRKQ